MAKFARKGSVSSSSKKSAAHNLVPLDKFLSTSRKKSDDTGHRDHDASSINVAHSHLPAAATEGNSIDTQEVYSCNLFEVSEDIENKVDREHQRREETDQLVTISDKALRPKSRYQLNVKPVTPCIKSRSRNSTTDANGSSTVKRNVHFNLEQPIDSNLYGNVGQDSRSCVYFDTSGIKNSEIRGLTTSSGDNGGVTCPICAQKVPLKSDINDHIDNCLTLIEVRNVLKEQSGLTNRVTSGSTSSSPDKRNNRADKRQSGKSKDSKSEGTQKKRKRMKYDSNKSELQSSLSDFLNRN